jgi:hypothetical protein
LVVVTIAARLAAETADHIAIIALTMPSGTISLPPTCIPLEGDREVLTSLAERLADVPTPAGPTPREMGTS